MNINYLYNIALTLIPNLGNARAKLLIDHFDNSHNIFNASTASLTKIPGIKPTIAKEFKNKKYLIEAEQELNRFEKYGNAKMLFYSDADFPTRLKQVENSPFLIYTEGHFHTDHYRTVGIVGTRLPSDRGIQTCEKLVEDLKRYDVQIISGLAHGIDSCVHRTCLDWKIPTLGVVGTGIDLMYPIESRKLANEMIHNGGIICQFPFGTPPSKHNFPIRNHTVASLSDAIIVVESPEKGGSIITAHLANDLNKDVFAVPGRINDHKSKGCNKLIKTNKASLIESAEDVAYIMGWESKQKDVYTPDLFNQLTTDQKKIIEAMTNVEFAEFDNLLVQTQLEVSTLSSQLLALEFQGLIKSLPGKKYVIK